MTEIAKLYNVPFEPDPEVMKPEEEAVEYSFSQGVPLIDFGAGAVGPPPLPFERPIGFDVENPKAGGSQAAGPSSPPPMNPEKGSLDAPPAAAPPVLPSNPSPPPTYDTVVPSSRPVPKPRTTVPNDELFPELPAVPQGTPQHQPKGTDNSDEQIDFDDLAKRFEALKKKK